MLAAEFYEMTRDVLGRGAFAEVRACVHRATGDQLAVKVIEKRRALAAGLEGGPARDSNAEAAAMRRLRRRVHKEVELFKTCKNQPHVLQLRDFFEDSHRYITKYNVLFCVLLVFNNQLISPPASCFLVEQKGKC